MFMHPSSQVFEIYSAGLYHKDFPQPTIVKTCLVCKEDRQNRNGVYYNDKRPKKVTILALCHHSQIFDNWDILQGLKVLYWIYTQTMSYIIPQTCEVI